jgi:hypothetical protein
MTLDFITITQLYGFLYSSERVSRFSLIVYGLLFMVYGYYRGSKRLIGFGLKNHTPKAINKKQPQPLPTTGLLPTDNS